jgi:hypothetical protein
MQLGTWCAFLFVQRGLTAFRSILQDDVNEIMSLVTEAQVADGRCLKSWLNTKRYCCAEWVERMHEDILNCAEIALLELRGLWNLTKGRYLRREEEFRGLRAQPESPIASLNVLIMRGLGVPADPTVIVRAVAVRARRMDAIPIRLEAFDTEEWGTRAVDSIWQLVMLASAHLHIDPRQTAERKY